MAATRVVQRATCMPGVGGPRVPQSRSGGSGKTAIFSRAQQRRRDKNKPSSYSQERAHPRRVTNRNITPLVRRLERLMREVCSRSSRYWLVGLLCLVLRQSGPPSQLRGGRSPAARRCYSENKSPAHRLFPESHSPLRETAC